MLYRIFRFLSLTMSATNQELLRRPGHQFLKQGQASLLPSSSKFFIEYIPMNKPTIIAIWKKDKRQTGADFLQRSCVVLLSLFLSERRRKRTTTRTLLAFKFRPFPVSAFAKNRRAVAENSNPPPPKRSPSHFTAMWLQISVTTRWSHGCRQPQLGLGSLDRDGSCSSAILKIDPLLLDHVWIWGGRWHATCCWSYLVFSPPLQMMKK